VPTISALVESSLLALALVLCLGLAAATLFFSASALEHRLNRRAEPTE
jgi:hypothetical protein